MKKNNKTIIKLIIVLKVREKRFKFIILYLFVKTTLTHFENLSNEIIYEIFDFLDMYHVCKAFFSLNIRFQNLLNSTLPVKINTSFLSKSDFERYYTQFIIPNINRITYLHLWNRFVINTAFMSLENIQIFNGQKILIHDNIDSDDLLEHLRYLSNFS